MSVLSAFNNVIINFMDDCILVFPEDNDFKLYKKGLQMYQKYNPKKILTIFNEYMNLYRQKILDKDDTFFLENDYEIIQKYNNKEIFEIINKIKTYWNLKEDNNKEKIWDYLLLLIKISDQYNA